MLGFSYSYGYFPRYSSVSLTKTIETKYIDTKVYVLFYKHVALEWTVPEEWIDVKFDVYRSETEYGTYHKLTSTPISNNTFKDTTTQDFSKFINGFYKVEALLEDGRRIQSMPITWRNKQSNWVALRAKDIERREHILLSKFTGIQSYIFKKRTFGKRCPNCWNTDIEKVTKDRCPVCLGTSFDGGYFPGYETLLQYDPTPNAQQPSYSGNVEPNVIQAWTTSYPEINSMDIILRVPDWKVYRVEQVMSTELQAVTVRQILSLNELDKESIEFQLAKIAIPERLQ